MAVNALWYVGILWYFMAQSYGDFSVLRRLVYKVYVLSAESLASVHVAAILGQIAQVAVAQLTPLLK